MKNEFRKHVITGLLVHTQICVAEFRPEEIQCKDRCYKAYLASLNDTNISFRQKQIDHSNCNIKCTEFH